MVADADATPFDLAIETDRKTVWEKKAMFAALIAKLRHNARNPTIATELTDPTAAELALMVVCTELIAMTLCRESYLAAKKRNHDENPN